MRTAFVLPAIFAFAFPETMDVILHSPLSPGASEHAVLTGQAWKVSAWLL
jgi:hypothetical protein